MGAVKTGVVPSEISSVAVSVGINKLLEYVSVGSTTRVEVIVARGVGVLSREGVEVATWVPVTPGRDNVTRGVSCSWLT